MYSNRFLHHLTKVGDGRVAKFHWVAVEYVTGFLDGCDMFFGCMAGGEVKLLRGGS
jgi:hypothetical protein